MIVTDAHGARSGSPWRTMPGTYAVASAPIAPHMATVRARMGDGSMRVHAGVTDTDGAPHALKRQRDGTVDR
ncbi:hypothetical protein BJD12_15400 [Xanthomonas vesicatoria ATCC 35937]|uniref:Uncharacterized protein n=1 Tax=Xanthomonas vesicatoria TaxID=56460 RepID=A0AAJ0IWG3_9XANT|nr:hypothetical protein BI313_18415 [Xanthomonas vesicatoria]APP76388.1 hypothetical protein BJD12_15400 [Xanthomonas vesicatoria ATCC 35937]KHM92507.1 hypothetical protein OR60_16415 [Xanthomonas vesicatoria]KHM92696.1 hypothetical protein OR61_16030 [Xanthomonas vesicatoria]KTF30128.1 hypothetical protein LMG920_20360 [Xanthomonas vesicatoria]